MLFHLPARVPLLIFALFTMEGFVAARVAEMDTMERQSDPVTSTTSTISTAGPRPVPGTPVGGGGGVVVGSVFDKFSIDYIEDVVLANFDIVASMDIEEDDEGSTTWRTFKRKCLQMGFMLREECAWLFLGVPKMESAEPDKNLVKGRSGLLNDYLGTISDANLNPKEKDERARLVVKVDEKKKICLAELPEVLKARKAARKGKDKLMRWAEVDGLTRAWLGEEFGEGTTEALGLSNVLRIHNPIDNGLQHLDIEEARNYTGEIWKGGMEALGAYTRLGGNEIILWCPQNREDIGRVASSIVKAIEMGIEAKITLVIPLDPKPKCHRVNQFTDLWTHELLQSKWSAFVKTARFSPEPVKVIVSGNFAPMHQTKSLCMITLSTQGGEQQIKMMKTRGSIGEIEKKEILIIDMAEEEEIDFVKNMSILKEECILNWHGPSRAPSTKAGEKRILYAGVVKEEGAWEARIALMRVKMHLNHMDVVVGLHSTFGNPDAILIEVSGAGAGCLVQELTEDAVMISSRLMLARSRASEKQWRDKVEELHQMEGEYIEKVRYRPSQGGETIATLPVLQEEKERKMKPNKDDEEKMKQVILRLRGEFIETRGDQAQTFMKMISKATLVQFDEEESEIVINKGQWKKLSDPRFGWKGDIITKCESAEKIIDIYKLIEGKTIEMGEGARITVEVIPHARLVIEARTRATSL